MQYRVDSSHQSQEKCQCAFMHNLCTLCINRMYARTITSTKCSETFRTTIICNIESIQATEVEKKGNVHLCTIYAHCARTGFFPENPALLVSVIHPPLTPDQVSAKSLERLSWNGRNQLTNY